VPHHLICRFREAVKRGGLANRLVVAALAAFIPSWV